MRISILSNLFRNLFNILTSQMEIPTMKYILPFVLFLSACSNALPVGYKSCATLADGTSSCDDQTPPGPGDDTGKPSDGSCDDTTANAIEACGVGNAYVDCENNLYYCINGSDGGANGSSTSVVIYVTVNSDGSVTYDDGDPTTPDCSDSIDNDGDGLTDFGSDPGCTSASDESEADSSGGGDTGGGSGDCVPLNSFDYCGGASAGIDDDCDGSVDNGDWDNDGFVSDDCTQYDGNDPNGKLAGDCDDSDGYAGYLHSALRNPGAVEVADWIDEDCDGNDDNGCEVLCDDDGDGHEEFELDGDSAFECVSAYFVADQSSDNSPVDATVSWSYDDGSVVTSYSSIGITCEASTVDQGNPANWDTTDEVKAQMCDALVSSSNGGYNMTDCLDLF